MSESPFPLLPAAFALLGALELGLTINALRPARRSWFVYQSFLASWWVGELALHHIVWQTLAAIAFIVAGALEGPLGWIGLGATVLSLVGLAIIAVRSHRHATSIEQAIIEELGAPTAEAPLYPRWHLLFPIAAFARRDIKIKRGVEYYTEQGARLRVDVYMPRGDGERRPALIQVHGGAWIVGFKWMQSIPLMTHLAANGWVCFNVDYRLSPRATFPDHLIDIKRAIAWVHDNAAEYGVDPSFIAIAGNSAGGHLASLAALTSNDPRYQPGFESHDTSVRACVSSYGVYDVTDGHHQKPRLFHLFMERVVFKASMANARARFEEASPMYRIHADAPPFLLIHGADDGVAIVEDARVFAERLRETSARPVHYVEVPGAGHLFDVFPSLRARIVTEATERFLRGLYQRYRTKREADAESDAADPDPSIVAG